MRCFTVVAMAAGALAFSAVLLSGPTATRPGGAIVSAAERDLSACDTAGTWLDPASGAKLGFSDLMERLADKAIVLLGESHTAAEHHRWQLHVMAGLSAHAPELVVGFEMFPRSVQGALDAWSRGGLSEKAFLSESRWSEVWGYDAAFYLPLFHFARQNRIPMAALNVKRALVSQVGRDGWNALPAEQREGLSKPAAAQEPYRRSLAEVFRTKLAQGSGLPSHQGGDSAADDGSQPPEISEILARDDFQRFVEAQLVWDRAMAEALFDARQAHPEALVIGVMGRGHVEHGHGVPHQLADLGESDVAVLLPVETGPACEALAPDVADAVFLVDPESDGQVAAAKPRLGVVIEAVDGEVEVRQVVSGSIAEATGLAAGDVILRAAEIPVTQTSELVEIIQRQAPGTWLPLDIRRDSEERQVLAKFPSRVE